MAPQTADNVRVVRLEPGPVHQVAGDGGEGVAIEIAERGQPMSLLAQVRRFIEEHLPPMVLFLASSDSDPGFDGLEERVEVGESPGFGLRMQLVAIDGHLKNAAAGGHQLQRTDSLFQDQQSVRQTDGSRFVVSSRAVLDDDLGAHDWIDFRTR